MKKILLLSTICLLAGNAYSMDIKPYVEGKISQNWMEAKYKEDDYFAETFKDDCFGASLEVGAKFDQFRLGIEGYYNDKMEDKLMDVLPVEGETKGIFLNAYYDIHLPNLEQVMPYIGVGIGYSWLKETADASSYGLGKDSAKDESVGWNIGLGMGFALNDNIAMTLGYRYENLGKIENYGNKTDFTNHKMSLGIRYTF